MQLKSVAVLGSTGSIGTQTLDVARRQNITVDVITARSNIALLEEQIRTFSPRICAVEDDASDADVLAVARSFGGVEHRIELVRSVRGVRYYNDSIASSPSRTIAGLHAFDQKVILIAGGYDKHIPFDVLGPEICAHVKRLILCGDTAEKIRQAVVQCPQYHADAPEISVCHSLHDAVNDAAAHSASGDVVTLSPACAAFDQFKNFMVRGKAFKDMVAQLPE